MKLKMFSVPAGCLTPEQYLEEERKAAFKSEYYQGETFAMAGATRWHSRTTKDTLLNPTALVEVLSESTKDYDRGQRFPHYRKLDSLRDYLAISQRTAHVEQCARQADGRWLLTDVRGLEAKVTLYSVNIAMPLSEIYLKVQLTED